MASLSVGRAISVRTGERLLASVADHGSGAHPYIASDSLLRGPDASRNLSDAVHFLCTLHGRYPGVVDHAANRCTEAGVRSWFALALEGFTSERAFLTRLAVAAGPLPSTPGAGDSEAAVTGQRHAMEMLAQSERNGCALGAAIALVLDWSAVRTVLKVAASRFGIEPPPFAFTDMAGIRAVAEDAAAEPPFERALLFGAEQVLIQHFGLWDLLEARQLARAAC